MIKYVAKAILAIIMICGGVQVDAQDLLASRAPIDRTMKTIDPIILRQIIETEQSQYPAYSLYPDWSNRYAHAYRNINIPDKFKIDLRGFSMPTPSRRITSHFGYRAAFGRAHKGLDIKVYTGDTIYAAFSGKVRVVRYEAGGYGNYIVIRHNNGLETIYGHLSKQLVRENENVRSGEPIGLGGSTGRSTGSHLHFEVRFLGEAINPEQVFDFPNQDIVSDYYVFRKEEFERMTSKAADHDNNPNTTASGPSFCKVKSGETLYSIARKYNTTVKMLRELNRLGESTKVFPGQIIRYL